MADVNLHVLDGTGVDKYEKAYGAGTNGDPNIVERSVDTAHGLGALLAASPSVSGSVVVLGTSLISGSVNVINLTANQVVSGSVTVLAMPGNSGSVNVVNLPANQIVSGSVTILAMPGNSGSVNVVNFPTQQRILRSNVTVDSNFIGQVWIAGSPANQAGPDVASTAGFIIKPHPGNTNYVWIMSTGQSIASGYPISGSEIFSFSGSWLGSLDFGTLTTTACVCWAKR